MEKDAALREQFQAEKAKNVILTSDFERATRSLDRVNAEYETTRLREKKLQELCYKLQDLNNAAQKQLVAQQLEAREERERIVASSQKVLDDVKLRLDDFSKEQQSLEALGGRLREMEAREAAATVATKEAEARARVADLEKKLEAAKHAQTLELLDKHRELIGQSQSALDKVASENERLVGERDKLSSHLTGLLDTCNGYKGELKKMQVLLEEQRAERNKLLKRLAEAEAGRQAAVKESEGVRAQVASLGGLCRTLTTERASLSASLGEAQGKLAAASAALGAAGESDDGAPQSSLRAVLLPLLAAGSGATPFVSTAPAAAGGASAAPRDPSPIAGGSTAAGAAIEEPESVGAHAGGGHSGAAAGAESGGPSLASGSSTSESRARRRTEGGSKPASPGSAGAASDSNSIGADAAAVGKAARPVSGSREPLSLLPPGVEVPVHVPGPEE